MLTAANSRYIALRFLFYLILNFFAILTTILSDISTAETVSASRNTNDDPSQAQYEE